MRSKKSLIFLHFSENFIYTGRNILEDIRARGRPPSFDRLHIRSSVATCIIAVAAACDPFYKLPSRYLKTSDDNARRCRLEATHRGACCCRGFYRHCCFGFSNVYISTVEELQKACPTEVRCWQISFKVIPYNALGWWYES